MEAKDGPRMRRRHKALLIALGVLIPTTLMDALSPWSKHHGTEFAEGMCMLAGDVAGLDRAEAWAATHGAAALVAPFGELLRMADTQPGSVLPGFLAYPDAGAVRPVLGAALSHIMNMQPVPGWVVPTGFSTVPEMPGARGGRPAVSAIPEAERLEGLSPSAAKDQPVVMEPGSSMPFAPSLNVPQADAAAPTQVPEPASLGLFAVGLLALATARPRRA
jgi:hypothetical protein